MIRLIARLLPRSVGRHTRRSAEAASSAPGGAHMPQWSQSFQATLPDQAAALRMADALAGRGHVLVAVREVDHFQKDPTSWWYGRPSVRPDEQGLWDVFSIATGPMPDSDAEWWEAQEDRAVRQLATSLGGRSAGPGGGSTKQLISGFTREGLVHELDRETVERRRLEAFARSPARAGSRETRKVDEVLADRPGEMVVLHGVDDVDWQALEHAYGPAIDVPRMLRALAANDDRWGDAHAELVGAVFHQGNLYSSSAPAVSALAELAASPRLAPERRLDLLYTLFLAGSASARADAYGHRPDQHAFDVQTAVMGEVDHVMPLWPSLSSAERRVMVLLAALAGRTVPDTDLSDPASRLARAMMRDEQDAEAVLRDLATRNEDLFELADGDAPAHSRLTAALETLLWEP